MTEYFQIKQDIFLNKVLVFGQSLSKIVTYVRLCCMCKEVLSKGTGCKNGVYFCIVVNPNKICVNEKISVKDMT